MQTSSRRLGIILALVFCVSLFAQPRRYSRRGFDDSGYGRARALVGRVQNDLRRAERFSRAEGREKERFENAQRHLSQFDEKLSRNDFDKDKLDEAIDDVKNVVENNTLSPTGRDDLRRDLTDLRQMRSVRGRL
ncbi:MAG TPA: hypothetical protein VHA11_15085 [Bryobacteraceae bacterium]|nr:hypothetical protein [Bryobacteraceae bacterium]